MCACVYVCLCLIEGQEVERGDEHSLSGGVALSGNVHVVKKAPPGKATHKTFTPTTLTILKYS